VNSEGDICVVISSLSKSFNNDGSTTKVLPLLIRANSLVALAWVRRSRKDASRIFFECVVAVIMFSDTVSPQKFRCGAFWMGMSACMWGFGLRQRHFFAPQGVSGIVRSLGYPWSSGVFCCGTG